MLYIVSTPIGNLEDITLRAIRTLKEVDLIAAEDTRHTGKLLKYYDITTAQTSYHEHNKVLKTASLIKELNSGMNIALVSDAGTPGVSDPGFYLLREALRNSIEVTTIPGPTAFVSALLLSGMPVDQFQFIGFLPPKLGKKKTKLETFKNYNKTIIAYESPYKIVKTLQAMQEVYGDIDICLCRELTKLHEEVLTKPISAWLLYYQEKIPKGEFVLLFVPY